MMERINIKNVIVSFPNGPPPADAFEEKRITFEAFTHERRKHHRIIRGENIIKGHDKYRKKGLNIIYRCQYFYIYTYL